METGLNNGYSKNYFEITNIFLIFNQIVIVMGKMREEFMKQQMTGSIGGDEDYLYEQYILQEKMNEEYWEYIAKTKENPDYIPTPEEEEQNFEQIKKQNGHT